MTFPACGNDDGAARNIVVVWRVQLQQCSRSICREKSRTVAAGTERAKGASIAQCCCTTAYTAAASTAAQ